MREGRSGVRKWQGQVPCSLLHVQHLPSPPLPTSGLVVPPAVPEGSGLVLLCVTCGLLLKEAQVVKSCV